MNHDKTPIPTDRPWLPVSFTGQTELVNTIKVRWVLITQLNFQLKSCILIFFKSLSTFDDENKNRPFSNNNPEYPMNEMKYQN